MIDFAFLYSLHNNSILKTKIQPSFGDHQGRNEGVCEIYQVFCFPPQL